MFAGVFRLTRPDGSTTFAADPEGPHEMGMEVDVGGFLEWFANELP